jgi:hypothetical protein
MFVFLVLAVAIGIVLVVWGGRGKDAELLSWRATRESIVGTGGHYDLTEEGRVFVLVKMRVPGSKLFVAPEHRGDMYSMRSDDFELSAEDGPSARAFGVRKKGSNNLSAVTYQSDRNAEEEIEVAFVAPAELTGRKDLALRYRDWPPLPLPKEKREAADTRIDPPSAGTPAVASRPRPTPTPLPRPPAPKPAKESWPPGEIVPQRDTTQTVVAGAANGITLRGGRVALELRDLRDGKPPMATAMPDVADSLWIIAAGGAQWRGKHLAEGRIYLVNVDGQPNPTGEEEYSAWLELTEAGLLYDRPDGTRHEVAKLAKGERLRLQMPAATKDGLDRVRRFGVENTEGYVDSNLKCNLIFVKHADRPAPVDTPAAPRPDPLAGEWTTPAFSLKIERGGTGSYSWLFTDGQRYTEVVGRLAVETKDGKLFVSMIPNVFGELREYRFEARLDANGKTLALTETNGRCQPKTLERKP